MSDINRRFSRAQWTQPPAQFGVSNDPYANANNSNHSFNVNEYYHEERRNILPNPSSESFISTATNATNATRRRFSVKLNQSPLFENGFNPNAPALPFNASAQIYNSSNPNLKETISVISDEENNLQETDYKADTELNPETHRQQLLNILSSEHFDVEKFIQMKLSDATAARIDDFAQMIEDASKFNEEYSKGKLAESISRVLAVSNTINETYNVLNTLKPKINELNDSLAQQLDEANEYLQKRIGPNQGGNSKVNRQSLMILQNKWTSNMRKLYAEIDKAHDMLPPLSSRHIIIESRRWGELNSISCKPIRPAHIVVLNDSILIASRVRTNTSESHSKGKNAQTKSVKNVATYCWMLENVTVEKGSDNKELSLILNNGIKKKLNTANSIPTSSGTDFETPADMTICIRTIDTKQLYLFQTDLASEFIRVLNSINQAKSKVLSNKRRSIRESETMSRTNSMRSSGVFNNSVSSVEKQVKPEFEQTVSQIDDLITSVSLELGLQRFEECMGYYNLLNEKLEILKKIAYKIGISKALLKSKHFSKADRKSNQSIFAQHVHVTFHMKVTAIDNLKEQFVMQLLHQVASATSKFETLKSTLAIFKALGKEHEAAEIYLDAWGRDFEECASMVRLGGSGVATNSSLTDNYNPRLSLNGARPMSRSASSQNLVGQNSRPASVGGGNLAAELDNEQTPVVGEDENLVISELVTAYVRELSLVYMGFIDRVWSEWNQLFSEDHKTSKISNVRIIEWVNDYISELKHAVAVALMNYERDSEVFIKSMEIMIKVFQPLKDKELNVDYLLKF